MKKLIDNPMPPFTFPLSDRAFSPYGDKVREEKQNQHTQYKNHVADKTVQDSASYGKLACH
jgi:ureidoglycolate hydrolase